MKTTNFDEIYGRILSEKDPQINKLQTRKRIVLGVIISLLIFFILTAIIPQINSALLGFVIMQLVFVCFFVFFIVEIKYRDLYQNTIIGSLVKNYSEELEFYSNSCISEAEYTNAKFPTHYDRFFSRGLIQGNIDNKFDIKMSRISLDVDSGTDNDTTVVFLGMFGFVRATNLMLPDFYVSVNREKNRYEDSRIEVDFANFEKYFDLYTEDKIRVMQVFTSDLIEEFVRTKEILNVPIEVKSKNGVLYFRIKSDSAFAAPDIKGPVSYDSLYKDYNLLDNTLKLISKIIENGKSLG